jgi:NitT/TauT family transport system permease protein
MLTNRNKGFLKFRKLALIILFWIALWEGVALIIGNTLLLPSPAETLVSLWGLVITTNFWINAAFTLYRVIFGLAISFVLGITLAFLASRLEALESLLRPMMAAVKSTPIMSIIVLALFWFNSSFVPVFSCALLCIPIFYTNTLAGIRSVDAELLEMANVYHVRHKRVVKDIVIPSVTPHICSALSVCLGFSWKSVVAAEVLSIPKYSMGYRMFATKQYLDMPGLFAWTIAIVLISLLVEKSLIKILPKGSAL